MDRDSLVKYFRALPPADKEIDELDDRERIALCIAAGCEMEFCTESDRGSYRMVARTVRPVGIVKVDGKFHVFERSAE